MATCINKIKKKFMFGIGFLSISDAGDVAASNLDIENGAEVAHNGCTDIAAYTSNLYIPLCCGVSMLLLGTSVFIFSEFYDH